MPKSIVDPITQHGSREVDREVHSVCPYCGVGCQLSYEIKDDKIAFVQGRNGYSNENRLCVKGRFGFDYVTNPQRLMKPLIRKPGMPKRLDVDPSNPLHAFPRGELGRGSRCCGQWTCARSPSSTATSAIAGFGSAKCSNEEAYLFQKLIRTRFRNNNVDHCTRLCHASSVAALIEGIGSGAVTATFNEVEHADVIMSSAPIRPRTIQSPRPSSSKRRNAAPSSSSLIRAARRCASTPTICCNSSRQATWRCSTPSCM